MPYIVSIAFCYTDSLQHCLDTIHFSWCIAQALAFFFASLTTLSIAFAVLISGIPHWGLKDNYLKYFD